MPNPNTVSLPIGFHALLPASSMLVPSSCPTFTQRIPVLVTQQKPQAGQKMLFELYCEPFFTASSSSVNWVQWMFSGAPTPGVRLSGVVWPNQPMTFVDQSQIAVPQTVYAPCNAYGYSAWPYQIPTSLLGYQLAVQALVVRDLDYCWVASNALAFLVVQ